MLGQPAAPAHSATSCVFSAARSFAVQPGRCSVGWAWFSLANRAPAPPASHVGLLGSYRPWPGVWFGKQSEGMEASSGPGLALCDTHHPVALGRRGGLAEPLVWDL